MGTTFYFLSIPIEDHINQDDDGWVLHVCYSFFSLQKKIPKKQRTSKVSLQYFHLFNLTWQYVVVVVSLALSLSRIIELIPILTYFLPLSLSSFRVFISLERSISERKTTTTTTTKKKRVFVGWLLSFCLKTKNLHTTKSHIITKSVSQWLSFYAHIVVMLLFGLVCLLLFFFHHWFGSILFSNNNNNKPEFKTITRKYILQQQPGGYIYWNIREEIFCFACFRFFVFF